MIIGVAIHALRIIGQDIFPDEFLLRSHFEEAPEQRLQNQRVAVRQALAVGGEAAEELVLLVIYPHDLVGGRVDL